MKSIMHAVPGLPDAWSVREQHGWFVPMLNGRALMRRDGQAAHVATFSALEDANLAAIELVARMQGDAS